MREWQLTATDPLSLQLAADARLFQTDYTDDQIWKLELGQGDSPALVLYTRYGRRIGLARLLPMWVIDKRAIYEASAYAGQPVITAFLPGYCVIEARPVSHVSVRAEFWAMTSHVIAGRFSLHNEGAQPTVVSVELFAQMITGQEEGQISLLTLASGRRALHLHDVGSLQPVVLMEMESQPPGVSGESGPRLVSAQNIPPGEAVTVRWVHAARPGRGESLNLAHHWLYNEDWAVHLARLEQLNAGIPEIETGDAGRDAAIAFSYKVLLNSFVGPTGKMPYPSFVLARTIGQGFSPHGDGGDHDRSWAGQAAHHAYSIVTAVSAAAPALAKGVIRNYLATGGADGFIDWRPGLGGQRDGALSAPLLATMAWHVYEFSEDQEFLAEVLPGLKRFFLRWFAADVDHDGDGIPEWRDTRQSGFDARPGFVPFLRWAQNARFDSVESPDLIAYLLREGRSLLEIAAVLDDKTVADAVQPRLRALSDALEAMWNAEIGSYRYRDRDSHVTTAGVFIASGPADQPLLPSLLLDPPNRLIVRILGGRDTRPKVSITIEGLDYAGRAVHETFPAVALSWYRGLGALTTEQVYSRVDRVTITGLSRIFTVEVWSIDWTRQDLTLLLPLWAGIDDPERAAALVDTLLDPARYWRSHGLPVTAASDDAYDPANQNGSGGVWMPWNLMIGEGLIAAGRSDLAAALLERLLAARLHSLRSEKTFFEGYNSDALEGLGEAGHVGGIVPLHLLWRLMGFRIVSPGRVWIGGKYVLPWPVTVRHMGVTIERDQAGAKITFPSGKTRRVRSEKWQLIEDPESLLVQAAGAYKSQPAPQPDPPSPSPEHKTIHIPVSKPGDSG